MLAKTKGEAGQYADILKDAPSAACPLNASVLVELLTKMATDEAAQDYYKYTPFTRILAATSSSYTVQAGDSFTYAEKVRRALSTSSCAGKSMFSSASLQEEPAAKRAKVVASASFRDFFGSYTRDAFSP